MTPPALGRAVAQEFHPRALGRDLGPRVFALSLHVRALGVAAALLGVLLVPAPAGATTCPRELGVRVRTPTSNVAALERVGVVRAIAGARVRDLHVMLKRDGRMLAQGSHAGAFSGGVAVALSFERRAAKAGRVSLVVTGRRAGCAARREARRTIVLERRDLPVAMTATDRDARDGDFAVAVRLTGGGAVSDLHASVLDARGDTIAQATRFTRLRASALLEFAPAHALASGRYSVLVTGAMGDTGRRGTVAATVLLTGDPAPAAAGGPPSPIVLAPSAPDAGAVVQHVAVSWSGGAWQGHESAGFAVPGIGDGQLVCRPDTQWLRVFPADRSRDVAMMLWTSRDWDGGSEVALREAQMTPFTGPDFNEGLNKFTPAETHSHGTFEGVVGDGLPAAGTFGAGRSPTEVRLSWSWDFSDPATASCTVSATFTSAGPGTAGAVARGLSLAWNGAGGLPADTTLATSVPGLGTVRLRCDAGADGIRQLSVEPDAVLPGLALTTFEGSDRSDRGLGNTPYVVPLPNNGLIEAATPSGAPLRLLLESRWKVNDPDPAQNFCRLSGIVVAG
jgi:hypothetical protein